MNVMVSLQEIIISVRDFLAKVQGILTATLFTSLGTYYTLKALLGAIAEFILKILIALAAIIALLWIFPVTWGAAAANTAIFVALSIPLALILAFFTEVLQIHPTLAIPTVKCFGADTFFQTGKTARSIEPGDLLVKENGVVTTKFTFLADATVQMFLLYGIVVSGEHLVFQEETTKWIPVREHPAAVVLAEYPPQSAFIYCFITTTNRLLLPSTAITRNTLFADWHDNNIVGSNGGGGFIEETELLLQSGQIKRIHEIQIGDVLSHGETVVVVVGLVKVHASFLSVSSVFEQEIKTKKTNHTHATTTTTTTTTIKKVLGVNIIYQCNPSSWLTLPSPSQSTQHLMTNTFLYHLITNTHSFTVSGIPVLDYQLSEYFWYDTSHKKKHERNEIKRKRK